MADTLSASLDSYSFESRSVLQPSEAAHGSSLPLTPLQMTASSRVSTTTPAVTLHRHMAPTASTIQPGSSHAHHPSWHGSPPAPRRLRSLWVLWRRSSFRSLLVWESGRVFRWRSRAWWRWICSGGNITPGLHQGSKSAASWPPIFTRRCLHTHPPWLAAAATVPGRHSSPCRSHPGNSVVVAATVFTHGGEDACGSWRGGGVLLGGHRVFT